MNPIYLGCYNRFSEKMLYFAYDEQKYAIRQVFKEFEQETLIQETLFQYDSNYGVYQEIAQESAQLIEFFKKAL